MRVAPTGPLKGISDIERAADAPIIPNISIGVSSSIERGVIII